MDVESTELGIMLLRLYSDPDDPEELLQCFQKLRGAAVIPEDAEHFLRYCQYRLTRYIILEMIIAKRILRKFPQLVSRGHELRPLCKMYRDLRITVDFADRRVYIGEPSDFKNSRKDGKWLPEYFKTIKVEKFTFFYNPM